MIYLNEFSSKQQKPQLSSNLDWKKTKWKVFKLNQIEAVKELDLHKLSKYTLWNIYGYSHVGDMLVMLTDLRYWSSAPLFEIGGFWWLTLQKFYDSNILNLSPTHFVSNIDVAIFIDPMICKLRPFSSKFINHQPHKFNFLNFYHFILIWNTLPDSSWGNVTKTVTRVAHVTLINHLDSIWN